MPPTFSSSTALAGFWMYRRGKPNRLQEATTSGSTRPLGQGAHRYRGPRGRRAGLIPHVPPLGASVASFMTFRRAEKCPASTGHDVQIHSPALARSRLSPRFPMAPRVIAAHRFFFFYGLGKFLVVPPRRRITGFSKHVTSRSSRPHWQRANR